MTRNWYAVYTRPLKERRVAVLLNKKGIECFCPLVMVREGRGEYKRQAELPLFGTVVFAHAAPNEVASILSTSYVVTLAYWKSSPAVISEAEIDIVKRVTDTYADIRLEKSNVEMGGKAQIIEGPSVKYKNIKVNLPSLGFTMVAENAKQKKESAYQPQGLFTSFPRRINSFLFN
jgi:transcription antitermination factor NusG